MKFFVRSSSGRIKKSRTSFRGKGLRINGVIKTEYLLHLGIQERIETGQDRGHDGRHGLVRGVEGRARQPSCLVRRWEQIHERLESIFSWLNWLGARRSCVSLNTEMMCRTSASPFLGGRNSDRSSVMAARAPSAAYVKICVLTKLAQDFTALIDDRLCKDLRILFCLCLVCQVFWILQV